MWFHMNLGWWLFPALDFCKIFLRRGWLEKFKLNYFLQDFLGYVSTQRTKLTDFEPKVGKMLRFRKRIRSEVIWSGCRTEESDQIIKKLIILPTSSFNYLWTLIVKRAFPWRHDNNYAFILSRMCKHSNSTTRILQVTSSEFRPTSVRGFGKKLRTLSRRIERPTCWKSGNQEIWKNVDVGVFKGYG